MIITSNKWKYLSHTVKYKRRKYCYSTKCDFLKITKKLIFSKKNQILRSRNLIHAKYKKNIADSKDLSCHTVKYKRNIHRLLFVPSLPSMHCSWLLLRMKILLVTSLHIFLLFRRLHSSTQSYSDDILVL